MSSILIYLLEDDPDIQQALKIILKRRGYVVVAFSTTKDFYLGMAAKKPGLCILDVNLPDGNGLDVCRAITTGHTTQNIPVVMMSAKSFTEDQWRAVGARAFISKPFRINEFMEVIERFAAFPAE